MTPSSSSLAPPPPPLLIPSSSLNQSKDIDLSTTDIPDDGNMSDSSATGSTEIICDDGPPPVTCDRGETNDHEYLKENQSTFFLSVYFRMLQSISRNCPTTSL